jgi:tetratricopeptide (TPR) repeat protein
VAPPSATPSPAASVALATPPAPAQAAQSSATQSPAAAPAPAPTALSSPTPEAKPSAEALTRSWRAAREAFAAGKPEAVDTYKALLKSYPDIPDLAGELGNVYYAGGKWREAGEQYYEAAQRYLRSPQPGYAACLLDVLRQMRAPEAEKLARDVKAPCPAASQTAGAQSGAAPQR